MFVSFCVILVCSAESALFLNKSKIDTRFKAVTGGARLPRPLHIRCALSFRLVGAGSDDEERVETLAPGATTDDIKEFAIREADRRSIDLTAAALEWLESGCWRPFSSLEALNPAAMRQRWQLKTTAGGNHFKELARIKMIERVAQEDLKEHYMNQGQEKASAREVCPWSDFLHSYTSREKDQGGVTLPEALKTRAGRIRAATLLAVVKGGVLQMRLRPVKELSLLAEEPPRVSAAIGSTTRRGLQYATQQTAKEHGPTSRYIPRHSYGYMNPEV